MSALYLVRPDTVDVSISAQAVHLAKEFSRQCGFRMLPYMVEAMTRYLLDGFEPSMIGEAIARTARAPRPSYAYLSAIMRNAAAAGQYDFASFSAARSNSNAGSAGSSMHYSGERQYTEAEWLSFSEDLIKAARDVRKKEV